MKLTHGRKGLTLTLDHELHDFFSHYAEQERQTMAGILRAYIVSLKKQEEAAQKEGE